MNYISLCSGIEAASVAWHPLGWQAVGFSEIDPFPCAVLAHRWPEVPNLGDMTQHYDWPSSLRPDLIVAGTPCQSFSVAGRREGFADPRGNLALVFLSVVARLRPRWILWENVPGVLSVDAGRAFGAFLGGLAQCGYGFAYRVLDAQHFGVPQRRRRVFVVGYFGDWRRAAAVLFEPESLFGNPAPRRRARQDIAGTVTRRTGNASRRSGEFGVIAAPVSASATYDRGDGLDSLVAFHGAQDPDASGNVTHPCGRNQGLETCALTREGVRRLTPRECERLQGFPDDHTLIPWRGKPASECPDAPRYKAIGNSMAVPVMRWLGERIERAKF